ncbi:pheromone A receptor-domain-containing protein [Aspergillus aurantiobrunneus]
MSSVTMSPSAQTVALQVLSTLALLASTPPLALHWKNRNFPAATLISWYILLNLFNIVNAFIWPTDDIENWWDGAGLCDIQVKLMISSYVAVPGCLLCIFRSLACVLDTSRATLVPSKRQRWRNLAMELLFCVGIPLVAAAMHLIYQGNRYFIFAVSGCVTSLDQSWVSLALGYIWPLVVCFIASYYCGLVLFRLKRYRSQFNEIFRAASSGLSKSRFLRLFFLSFIMLLVLTPVQAYIVYMQIKMGLPWHSYSWETVHGSSWSTIEMVPTGGEVYFDRWIPVGAGFMAFAFFGCGRDASMMYRLVLRPFGLDCCFSRLQTNSTGSFPHDTSGSSGSRAHLIPGRSPKARADLYHTARTGSTGHGSKDLEKGVQPPKAGWLKTHFSLFGRPFPDRHEGMCSSPHLAVPSNTISTNAWAGSSCSRESVDLDILPSWTDFIRVKQVIRQEREMQV